jgi:cytochrome P450
VPASPFSSLNFMLAGRDTTATALTWLFYYMSSHPEIEQQCADEVASALDSGVDASAEAIKSLTFLEATFMETTRLATPVPVDMKLCLQTCRFPSGEIIPAGTYVIYSPYLLGRLPSFYEGASGVVKTWAKDCEQFRPARWMTQDEDGQPKVLQPAPHEFPTFNVGPRLCLGKSMAILEGKTLAANILQTFRIKVRPGFEVTQRVAPVLAMLHGLPVTVEYRK